MEDSKKQGIKPMEPTQYMPFSPELRVSYEFFPPKTDVAEASLWAVIDRLETLHPGFVSVTYGAGGATRDKTFEMVTKIARQTSIPAVAHLTCIGHTKAEIDAMADQYWQAGITRILALRGDPPKGQIFVPPKDGYAYASDLVAGLKARHDFDIIVAGYPEMHPEAKSAQDDLDHLKRKVDAGASQIITQFFFEPAVYLRFVDKAEKAGIDVPIVPGILPVTNFAKVLDFAKMCGTSVPTWLGYMFEGLDDDPQTRQLVSASVAAEQCRQLQAFGINDFHFYTLNRAELAYAISHMLGLRPHGVQQHLI